MADDSIPKKVVQGLGQIGAETGKEAVKEILNITESVITSKELLGDINVLSDRELAQKKAEDERKKQQEMEALKSSMGQGRNLDREIEQIRDERKREEEQKEKQMLEQIRQQREAEEMERQQMVAAPGNQKRQAAKMQNAPAGKKKKQQPDPTQMSATSEFTGGKID